MKSSEKIKLLLKGVTMDEVKALEEQEAAEEAAITAEAEAEEAKETNNLRTALEAAQEMVKDLEIKLEAKEDELTKLNQEFANLNNKQTIAEKVEAPTASDVMGELFKTKKEV